MFKNYLKTALRHILKNRLNTIINIIGLSVGICAVMLFYFYISFEISYDTFQKDADRIYRLSIINSSKENGISESVEYVDPLAPTMKDEIPEVEQYCRVSTEKIGVISSDNKHLQTTLVKFADSTFFGFFSYELIKGDAEQVLNRPFTAVLSEETSERLFGSNNPVGKIINFNNTQYEITGLVKNPPKNSHLNFNVLLSFRSLFQLPNTYMGWNGGQQYINYVKLKLPNQDVVVNKKLKGLMWNYENRVYQSMGLKKTAYLQPLKDIHLKYDDEKHTRLTNIYVFSVVAILILIIACINYVNLTIAGSLKRNREVGVRKVFGASKILLVRQFVTESFVIIVISSLFSLVGLYLIMPFYKKFIGDFFNADVLINLNNILIFLVGVIFVSLAASFYPAFYLSRMSPIEAINEKGKQRFSKINMRNALILFQFITSIGLISTTLIIESQLDYIKKRDIGYKKDNIMVLHLNNNESREKFALIKGEIEKIAGVISVTASSEVPVNGFTANGYMVEGNNRPTIINIVDADKDFLNTYKIKIVEGRNFSEEFGTDKNSYLVNEEFVKKFGLINPVGKTVNRRSEHKIIGVVSNFNFASAYKTITPLLISNYPEDNTYNYISVKLAPVKTLEIIKSISAVYKRVCTGAPLEYSFLNEELAQVYRDEDNFKTLFIYFALLAILISVVGLLGLTSISLSQKKKEIVMRKVLGASTISIVRLTYKEYFMILLIAFVIASALSKYFTDLWLNDFVLKIVPSVWLFVEAGAVAIIISFITVLFFAVKAAHANPVESLRYE
jgi:putative ABC transport system permease protein